MKQTLKYADEADKAYGITGMTIGLYVYDGEDYLTSVSLDSENSMNFSPEFYFSGNPRLSAKSVWTHLLKQYEMSVAMTVSNILCRSLAARGEAPAHDMRLLLRNLVAADGRDACSLDDDEISEIFNRLYDSFSRVFNHSGVREVASAFAKALSAERTLEHDRIAVLLNALRRM